MRMYIKVFTIYKEEGVTKVIALDRNGMRKLLELSCDIFVNLDELVRGNV